MDINSWLSGKTGERKVVMGVLGPLGALTPFEALFIAHLLGDWFLQTDYEANNKAKGPFFNWALWKHCLVYTACFVPFFFALGIPWGWLALILGSHLFLDRRWPIVWILRVVKRMTPEAIDRNFWLVVAVDQVTHILVLAFIAARLA